MPSDGIQERGLYGAAEYMVCDVAKGVQPAFARADLFIESGVGDRHSGLGRQNDQGVLVFLAKLVGPALIGKVDVPEDPTHRLDRGA